MGDIGTDQSGGISQVAENPSITQSGYITNPPSWPLTQYQSLYSNDYLNVYTLTLPSTHRS